MELLLTIIIVLVRHNETKVQVRKDTAKQIFRDSKSAAEDTEGPGALQRKHKLILYA